MAVYTRIDSGELAPALRAFGLQLRGAPREVSEGIENTTYFLTATNDLGQKGEYVLTILENVPAQQMDFSARLCGHLAAQPLPVPAPLVNAAGDYHCTLAGKPALILPRAKGGHPDPVTADHCAAIGGFMAQAHVAGQGFPHHLANSRGQGWLAAAADALAAHLPAADRDLLEDQLRTYRALLDGPPLPVGAIHGDLFTDNCLFVGSTLSAVIDFYNACTDWLLLDVAIAVNDWCARDGGAALDGELCQAFLGAYHRHRPFTDDEGNSWQAMLGIAACRFWVSRLAGRHAPQLLGGHVKDKDPDQFRDRVRARGRAVAPLPRAL